MHEVLVNRLGGLSLPRKSVVRLTDRPDMTLDVYRGRKTTMQQQQRCVRVVRWFWVNFQCRGVLLIWGGGGWSGGAMVLGKLPVPGRPTNLAYSRARAYCAFSRCGWGLFGHFYSPSFSLSLGDGLI